MPQHSHIRKGTAQPIGLERVSDEEWALYQTVIRTVRSAGHRFVLGGAFALATYTGQYRNTKDLDLFILPETRDAIVELLTQCGLQDYYDEEPYDRGWIYRAVCEGTIVDVIWTTANRHGTVDEAWLTRGPEIEIRGERVRIMPVEDLIWVKLYILHRDRCDWTDVLNLLYAAGPTLDWEHLLQRVGEDWRLLAGSLSVFAWMCPGRAASLPRWVWERLSLPAPVESSAPDVDRRRVDLLDTRPWFVPVLEPGEEPFSEPAA